MLLGLTTSVRAPWTVVHLHGELDMATAPRLRQEVVGLVDTGERYLVLDLSDVDFCDSTGIGVLVAAVKRARVAGGDVRVVCTNDRLLQMFALTRLDRVFEVFDVVDAALDPSEAG